MNGPLVGEIIGPVLVKEYLGGQGRADKYLCECIGCGSEIEKWSTTLYAHRKGRRDIKYGCKKCYDRSMRREDLAPAILRMYFSYQSNARVRNLPFDLTAEEFYEIAKDDCFYCGFPPIERKPPKSWQPSVMLSGVDRVVNATGYTVGNCVACCRQCNWAKKDMSSQDFIDWCARVVLHQRDKRQDDML